MILENFKKYNQSIRSVNWVVFVNFFSAIQNKLKPNH